MIKHCSIVMLQTSVDDGFVKHEHDFLQLVGRKKGFFIILDFGYFKANPDFSCSTKIISYHYNSSSFLEQRNHPALRYRKSTDVRTSIHRIHSQKKQKWKPVPSYTAGYSMTWATVSNSCEETSSWFVSAPHEHCSTWDRHCYVQRRLAVLGFEPSPSQRCKPSSTQPIWMNLWY